MRTRLNDRNLYLVAAVCAAAVATEPMTAADAPSLKATRTVFFRDEQSAEIPVVIDRQNTPDAPRTVTARMRPFVDKSRTIPAGVDRVSFSFAPAQMACGDYGCRLGVTTPGSPASTTDITIAIVPAIPPDRYPVMSWDPPSGLTEWFGFAGRVGLNGCGIFKPTPEQMDALARHGMVLNWDCFIGKGNAHPTNRGTIRAETAQRAGALVRYPHWRYALLNCERGLGKRPDGDREHAWLEAQAERELGFALPREGWASQAPHNPDYCKPTFAGEAPADGVYAQPPLTYRALEWWMMGGAPLHQVGWMKLGFRMIS